MSARKSVRFQDLSLIQEQEEDGTGEVTFEVPKLPRNSPCFQGETEAPVKPAACPFGERIAKERAAKERQSQSQSAKYQCPNQKFPRNIILLQKSEKERAAKNRPTAGVNPHSGKERGKSFVVSRSYLYNRTQNSVNLQAGGQYKKTFDVSKSSQPSAADQSPVDANNTLVFPEKSAIIEWTGQERQFVPASQTSEICQSKEAFEQALASASRSPTWPVQGSDRNTIKYQPEANLSQTVNPFCAPSRQLYGGAAYQLKDTPQGYLSKPDIITSAKANQYLHQPVEQNKFSQCIYSTAQPLSPSTQTQSIQDGTVSGPENFSCQDKTHRVALPLQFLRENFSCQPPIPISKDRLFHLEDVTTRQSDRVDSGVGLTSSHTNCARSRETQEQRRQQSPGPTLSTSEVSCVPIVGPIVSSPRKVCVSSSPQAPPATSTTSAMNYIGGSTEIYKTAMPPLSRMQEKEELQRLNERFSAYVSRVRQLGQQANNVDTSAFMRSTKILEDEIVNLKNMYEAELEKLRQEIDAGAHERNTLHVQYNKQQKYVGELQDRLSIETDKTSKLMDEINLLQRKIGNLEAEIQDARVAAQRPQENLNQLQRNVENLTREVEQWKHRYEHEQVARQEAEDKVQQIMKKLEFSDQVHNQQVTDYQTRLDTSAATILSLESRVRELSTADVTVSEMLKQVRDTAETELKKYQIESEEQYSRNLSALKAQIDNDADALQRYSQEKSELIGSIGELQAKIRNLEGQVANLQHQKKTLEDAVSVERNRAADNIRGLEKKLRDVQDMLVVKMREVTTAREASIPLKAEIETLKALLEEEERRLRVPLGIVSASVVQTSMPHVPTTSQILTTSSLNALKASTTTSQQQQQQPLTTTSSHVQTAADARKASLLQELSRSSVVRTQDQVAVPLSCMATSSAAPAAATVLATDTVPVSANFNYSSAYPNGLDSVNPMYPYVPSPPLNTMYIPEALRSTEEGSLAYDADFGAGLSDCDLYMHGFSLPMTGPRYMYEATPSVNCLHIDPSPPLTPRAVGPIQGRAKSAPAKPEMAGACTDGKEEEATTTVTDKNVKLIPSSLGCGRDYFEEMFHDLQKDTLFPKARPKSSPLERRLPSTFHDYTVSTSSAIGDLKILEVNQDGKFVRLVNDGPAEYEFGGFMIQQNVGGHPVAVFRFPPRIKFAPDSTITVWSAMNDPHLHSPPTDFYWKEQQKWGTGPECTTILCRANGQAVAWTTAAHRFTKDAFEEVTKTKRAEDDDNKYSQKEMDEVDENLTELNIETNGPKPEPIYLRREKQQPPCLTASKHPHGTSPATYTHPHTGQQRPLRYGNDNSTYSRQSRTQSTRPDPIPGQPYSGAPAQRLGSAPLKKMGGNQSSSQPPTIRGNGTLANKSAGSIRVAPPSPFLSPLQEQLIDETRDRAISLMDSVGETCEGPSPFMKPHNRFASGLEQIRSQHHPDFLPPMPHPTQTSC